MDFMLRFKARALVKITNKVVILTNKKGADGSLFVVFRSDSDGLMTTQLAVQFDQLAFQLSGGHGANFTSFHLIHHQSQSLPS